MANFILFLTLGAGWVGLILLSSHFYKNWADDPTATPPKRGYGRKLRVLWSGQEKDMVREVKKGQTVQETFVKDAAGNIKKETIPGIKQKLKEKWPALIPMVLIPIITIYILKAFGDLWASVALGIIIGSVSSWREKIDFERGLRIALVVFLGCLILSDVFLGAFFWAAVIFMTIGPPTYLLEEVKKKNLFPMVMLNICLTMMAVNLVLAVLFLTSGHESYYFGIPGGLKQIPLLGHLFAEVDRGYTTGGNLLGIVKWFFVGLLIAFSTGPAELKKKISEARTAKTGEKGEREKTGILTFLGLDLFVEAALYVAGRKFSDETKKVTEKTKK